MQTGNNPTRQDRHYRPHVGEARPLNVTGRWRRNDLTTPGSNPGDVLNLPTAGTDYHVPFGGTKKSSYGPREQGFGAVDFYTQVKTSYSAI